jgi:6-phosphofructokinase
MSTISRIGHSRGRPVAQGFGKCGAIPRHSASVRSVCPSNYALVVLSEGAEWEGYAVHEYGEPDAYGHRKKASVAELFANEIKARAGEEAIASDLTYDLRSGDPDFIDQLVALTFGNMAYDAILDGKTGLMSAMVNYDLVPFPDPRLGPRKADVATMYNTERYRPIYVNKRGLPIFLSRA